MNALRNLACAAFAAALLTGTAGVANADHHAMSNHATHAKGAWYYSWFGPENLEFGTPDQGTMWKKEFAGEVKSFDGKYMTVAAEGSGDLMGFYLYNSTAYTPCSEGIRVGSKVKVHSDDRHRVRSVMVVPFHTWFMSMQK